MKSAPFDYVSAASVEDAAERLTAGAGGAVVISGGQSLMPLLALRLAPAETLVDVSGIAGLKVVAAIPGGVRIGAGVTHADIEDGKVEVPARALMQRVAAGIAYRSIRNHGTIGGSVALADPAADWPACLLALGASVRITGPSGERVETIDRFLLGAYTTSLQTGEIITAFDVPQPAEGARFGWAKVVRKSGAFAMSIGCVVCVPGVSAAVVLGGTTTRPVAMPETATLVLRGATANEATVRKAIAGDLASGAPDADDYQRRLHTATLLRAIGEAA